MPFGEEGQHRPDFYPVAVSRHGCALGLGPQHLVMAEGDGLKTHHPAACLCANIRCVDGRFSIEPASRGKKCSPGGGVYVRLEPGDAGTWQWPIAHGTVFKSSWGCSDRLRVGCQRGPWLVPVQTEGNDQPGGGIDNTRPIF